MKISIITATFNSELTVRDTLNSVNQQTYSDIEHIIIDGQSTDNTLSILNKYHHIDKIISEPDNGIYDAMNKGILFASGDIIGILNSDDFYIDNNVLKDVSDIFNRNKNIKAVYADLMYIDHLDTNKTVRIWKSGEFKKKSFLYGWMPPHPTFFVRKDVYEKYGAFNLQMNTAADYELMLRFLYKYEIECAYLNKIIVKMRTGGASNQTLKARIRAHYFDKKAWEINGLKPYWFTLLLKPIRKIPQYLTLKNQ